MHLLEALKEAKNFLSKGAGDEKSSPICFAITNGFRSRYGCTATADCFDLKARTQLNQARGFIAEKLAALQKEHNLHEHPFFTNQCGAIILGFHRYKIISFEQKQQARHLWLDQLIKELESANTN